MLISIDWIKEFVTLPELSPKEIGSKFTLATAEVEDVKVLGAHLSQIRVAEIVSFERHPEADKLNLVTFKISATETRKVVCGASNVKVGLKTPFAPIGVTLPIGLTLEPKKIRGVLSEGMLCSEEELGLKDESDGIMELPSEAPVGMTLAEYWKAPTDILLDVDNKSLTHRPDLWGHFGMAREFATIFNSPLKNPYDSKWKDQLTTKIGQGTSPVKVKLQGESAGLAYFGLSIDGVKVTDSPEWLKQRITSVGLRSINSIVDISNYVMLELGMPNHIFDREQIAGNELVIKQLGQSATFKTLDEVDRQLVETDTVICDANGPLVLAGIMGGQSSGVSEKTTNIFLEVANWKPALVRRTSTRLGLRTDSSQRYEKTLDSQLCERTLFRLLDLILKLNPDAKVVGKIEYDGIDLSTFKPLTIKTTVARISKTLGKDIAESEVLRIFDSLDFKVQKNGNDLLVSLPSYRTTKDIEYESDLFEEIGRMIGFDNISASSPQVDVFPVKLSQMQKMQRRIRDFLVMNARAFEIQTYPLVGSDLLKQASWPDSGKLVLVNSLSKDHDRMRPSLIPSFLDVASENVKNFNQFRMFELGRAYLSDDKDFSRDQYQLAMAFYHESHSPFMELLNTVEKLLNSLGLPYDFAEKNDKFPTALYPLNWTGAHPFEQLNVRIMGKNHGLLMSIHPLVLKSFKIKGHFSMFVLDLSSIESQSLKEKTKYIPLNKFPMSTFDWTVVADTQAPIGPIVSLVKKLKMKELSDVSVADVFYLKDSNQKAVTLRAIFSDPEKTLTGDFLSQAENLLLETTEKAGFPLRK